MDEKEINWAEKATKWVKWGLLQYWEDEVGRGKEFKKKPHLDRQADLVKKLCVEARVKFIGK